MMVLCAEWCAHHPDSDYRERVGQSMVCGNRWVAAGLGLRMVLMITQMRLAS